LWHSMMARIRAVNGCGIAPVQHIRIKDLPDSTKFITQFVQWQYQLIY
jgi:hypothetical protein